MRRVCLTTVPKLLWGSMRLLSVAGWSELVGIVGWNRPFALHFVVTYDLLNTALLSLSTQQCVQVLSMAVGLVPQGDGK